MIQKHYFCMGWNHHRGNRTNAWKVGGFHDGCFLWILRDLNPITSGSWNILQETSNVVAMERE